MFRIPYAAMASSSDLLSSAATRVYATAYANGADDCCRPYRGRTSVAVRTQMPTLMREKRFRLTPASSSTFWTDFLLSRA
ncbi:hypothetical protein STENM223S_06675 [Streptomyces tendae]